MRDTAPARGVPVGGIRAKRRAAVSRRWPIVVVRTLGVLFALGTFVQAVLAGHFVTGDVDLLTVHSGLGGGLILIPMAMLPSALLLWWFGRGPAWYIACPVLLFALVTAQIAAGHSRNLALHIPLGTSLAALAAWHVTWSFGYRRHLDPAAAETIVLPHTTPEATR